MAFSSGPRAGGSGGAGGSSKVGFVQQNQSNALSVSNSANNFTTGNFTTPSWQLTLKESGKGSLLFGLTFKTAHQTGQTGNADYEVKLQVSSSASQNSGFTTWHDFTVLNSNGVVYKDDEDFTNETSIDHFVSGEVPFNLSDLPASINNNQYLRFRMQVRMLVSPAPGNSTFQATDGYLALKSFGVGAGSTNVGPSELGITESASDAGKAVVVNTAGTGFDLANIEAPDNSITTAKLVDDAVTGAKIADDAVGADQIADNAVGSVAIADNAVSSAKIADGSITSAKIVDSTIVPDDMSGISNNANNANHLVAFNSTGTGFASIDHSSLVPALGDGAVDTANLADDAVTSAKIADDAVQAAQIADGSVDTARLAEDAVTPSKVAGITTGAGAANKMLVLDDQGSAFTTRDVPEGGGGGGGTPDDGSVTTAKIADDAVTAAKLGDNAVVPASLDGVTGGSGDAAKFIKTNSDGTEFVADTSIEPADLDGMSGGSGDGSKFIKTDSTGNAFEGQTTLTPSDIGLTEGSGIGGQIVQMNAAGTAFTSVAASGGGATVTLDNITGGPLATSKGGTGFNASDLDDLRTKMGIQTAATDQPMVYCANANTQKNNTIHRVDSSTTALPTTTDSEGNTINAIVDGILIRAGNDQYGINLADGKRWVRTLVDNNTGTWGSVADASLSTLNSAANLRGLADGAVAKMTSGNFRPQFTDNSYADEVIIGRSDINGNEYLIAINRSNFWWANRPASGDSDPAWTNISWQWEGITHIPQGLYYSGGEADEEHIPPGDLAVLGYQSGIDGEGSIHVMVAHSLTGTTSTYTGYFIDDDFSETIKTTQNTRGYTVGTWSRTKLDEAGIDDSIMIEDGESSEAVFLGIVPAINDLTFTGYTFKTSGFPSAGDVVWSASQRGVRIVHAAGDDHVNDIFQRDFEVEIRKDASNYIRGVFSMVATPGGATQAVYREDDLQVVGTINHNDTVEIRGHKAVITKADEIYPINLGLSHGSGEANKFVRMSSTGNDFVATRSIATGDIADDAITQAKIADDAVGADQVASNAITPDSVSGVTAANNANKVVAINSSANGFTLVEQSSGGGSTPADGSITTAKLADGSVTNAKLGADAVTGTKVADDAIANEHIADDAVDTAQIADGAVNTARLATDAVTNAKIADDAVGNEHIANNAVDTAQLAADAVTGAKVEDGAIDTEHLASGAVTAAKMSGITPGNDLSGHAVVFNSQGTGFTSAVLNSGGGGGSGSSGQLVVGYGDSSASNDQNWTQASTGDRDDSVATSAWQMSNRAGGKSVFYYNGWVRHNSTHDQTVQIKLQVRWASSTGGLSSATWTNANVFNNDNILVNRDIPAGLRNESLDITAAVPFSLSSLPSGAADAQYIQYRVQYRLTANNASTQWTFSKSRFYGFEIIGGSASVADGSITGAKLADDAVTNAKIADDAVGAENIADGAVGNAALASDAVTGAKIADDAVDTAHIADDAVEGAQIADNAVGQAAIADDAVGADQLASAAVVPGSISGLTAGSGIASKVLAFDSTGTAFTAVDQASGGGGGTKVILRDVITNTQFTSSRTNGVSTLEGVGTAAWQLTNRSTEEILINVSASAYFSWSTSSLRRESIDVQLQVRWSDTETFSGSWNSVSLNISIPGGLARSGRLVSNANNSDLTSYLTTAGTHIIPLSVLPAGATNGKYLQFRVQFRGLTGTQGSFSLFGSNFVEMLVEPNPTSNGGGGGSSTPANNSITTAMLQDDAVTSAKIANDAITQNLIADNAVTNDAILDGTIDLDKLATMYQSTGNYTFQSNVVSGVDDGKMGYTDGGATGQVAFNMLSADSGLISQFLDNRWIVLWKNALNYVIAQQDGAAETVQGDSTQGEFDVDNVYKVGSFANNDTVKLYFGSGIRPQSLLKINALGDVSVGSLEPDSLGINPGSTNANRIITLDNAGTGFAATPSSNTGMMKATLLMRNNTGSNETNLTVGSSRTTWTNAQNMQTGAWTVANKATDWLQVSACGLYYFGHIPAQPIIADLELWVRWRSPGESWENWNNSSGVLRSVTTAAQPGVTTVDLGGDRLQVTKLFAGGSIGSGSVSVTGNPVTNVTYTDNVRNDAHVDCAVPSGVKTIKLSQLHSQIADGDEVQFTVGFTSQNSSDSPGFTVRNFFLQVDILDGTNVHANY